MMSEADKRERARRKLVGEYERRRLALGVSKRGLAREARLEPSYYGHWVNGDFQFPTQPMLAALDDALENLEMIQNPRQQRAERILS
ncbi:XRE family transcriptional regulator [Parasedimentitalea marina]|uniref:XRE family transcriptional regulator n=1 Tax=Parasedimentitalea marina TaxID=2483033 RepID=A0A3T0N1S2_9RHOB|nr:XRE family transcriptional regulator [Parasedimentitalea marina]